MIYRLPVYPVFLLLPLALWYIWSLINEVISGVLYRRKEREGSFQRQLVIPKSLQACVLYELHEGLGHQGIQRTWSLISDRFYWVGMWEAVCVYCRSCCCCCCSRRSVHMDGSACANAITASGCSIRADSKGAVPPNSRIRLRAVAGHSWSQCSSVSGAPCQYGQVAEESASTMFRYAASLWQWPLRS